MDVKLISATCHHSRCASVVASGFTVGDYISIVCDAMLYHIVMFNLYYSGNVAICLLT